MTPRTPFLVSAFAAAALSLGAMIPAEAYAQVAPDAPQAEKTPGMKPDGLTAKQWRSVTDAKTAYAKARDPETKDWSIILSFEETLLCLRDAGFDTRKGEGFALLETTKAEFDAAMLPSMTKAAKLYFEWSQDREETPIYALSCMDQLDGMLKLSGYDFETDAPYKLIGTTRGEYEKVKRDVTLNFGRDNLSHVGEEQYNSQACLYNAKNALRRLNLDLTKEESYAALGTTKAEFERLEKKYGVLTPPFLDAPKNKTPAPGY